MADARGSKRGRPTPEQEQEQEQKQKQKSAPAASGFAPVPVRRAGPAPTIAKSIPLMPVVSNETTQYQVPLELLVLARNKEKDKARSVAVTPVAPRPNSDEPPPSSELSGLRVEQPPQQEPSVDAAAVQVPDVPEPALPVVPSAQPLNALSEATAVQVSASRAPARAPLTFGTVLAWLVVTALCLGVSYFAVELLRWF